MTRGRDGVYFAAGQGAWATAHKGSDAPSLRDTGMQAKTPRPSGLRLGPASAASGRLTVPDPGTASSPFLASIRPAAQRGSRGILLEALRLRGISVQYRRLRTALSHANGSRRVKTRPTSRQNLFYLSRRGGQAQEDAGAPRRGLLRLDPYLELAGLDLVGPGRVAPEEPDAHFALPEHERRGADRRLFVASAASMSTPAFL